LGLKVHKGDKEHKEVRGQQVIQVLKERLVIQVLKVPKEPKVRQQEPKGYKEPKERSVTKEPKEHQQVLKVLKEVQEVQVLKEPKVLQQAPKVI
jgi:hypothetical protein